MAKNFDFSLLGSFRALKNGVTPVVIIRHTLCTNWQWLNVGLLSCRKTLFTPWKNYFISNRFFNISWFVTVFHERLCTNWRWHNFNRLSWLKLRLYAMEKRTPIRLWKYARSLVIIEGVLRIRSSHPLLWVNLISVTPGFSSHVISFFMAYKRSLSHDKRLSHDRQLGPQGVTDYNYRCYPIFKCPKRPPKVKNQNFRPCYDFFI